MRRRLYGSLENLSSEVLNRNVKVSMLACFGDIALAIGPKFEPGCGLAGEPGACGIPFPSYVQSLSHTLVLQLTTSPSITSPTCARVFLKLILELSRALRRPSGVCHCSVLYFSCLLCTCAHSPITNISRACDPRACAKGSSDSGEPLDKLAYGVIGNLADAYPNGDLKPVLLAEGIGGEDLVLRKGHDKETKMTVRWALDSR